MKKIGWILLFTVILMGNTLTSAGQTLMNEVSNTYLDKLIKIAKETYPRTKYFQGRVEAGKIFVKQQKLSWFDSFNFSYIYQPNNTIDIVKPNLFNGYQIGMTVNLGTALQTPLKIKRAKQEFLSLQGEQEDFLRTLEATVKERYFNYLKAKKLLEAQNQTLLHAESIESQQRVNFERSEIPLKLYNEALVLVGSYTAAKITQENEVLQAKVALEELLGQRLEDIQ